MGCKQCGKELPPPAGRRPREYCNDACKQAHYRSAHQPPDASAELARAQQSIAELEYENARLRSLLDVERRYHADTQSRGFKAWIRNHPATPLIRKLLADPAVPPRGSRGLYEAHLRRLGASDEEQVEFAHLWKLLMLKS